MSGVRSLVSESARLCGCGCGGTVLPKRKFIQHHHLRGKRGNGYKTGTTQNGGYPMVLFPGHPRADVNDYVKMHILVAETALGKPLPAGAVVHHVDEDHSNYRNLNLVICQNVGYHMLLHRRLKSYRECGHADWVKCYICKQYGPPEDVFYRGSDGNAHSGCHYKGRVPAQNGFANYSPEQRKEIARKGAEAFWRKKKCQTK